MHYKLMKPNFVICLVILLSSWWQQPLGKKPMASGAKME